VLRLASRPKRFGRTSFIPLPVKLKLLCDENIDRHIVLSLRVKNFDVRYISEEHQGIEDTDVLEIATRTSRVLLTEDKDFGELCFEPGGPLAASC